MGQKFAIVQFVLAINTELATMEGFATPHWLLPELSVCLPRLTIVCNPNALLRAGMTKPKLSLSKQLLT